MAAPVTAAAPCSPAGHGDVTIVRVTPDAIGDVLAVLSDAARWLRVEKRIIDQWPPVFAAGDYRAEQLRAEAEQGRVLVAYRGGVPLATVTLTPWADPDFAHGWPGGTGGALYLLRLAVTARARREGLQLGARLLDHAADLAARPGVDRLRLDCSRTNTALHAYYERHGFRQVGEVRVPGRRSGTLFERVITSSGGSA